MKFLEIPYSNKDINEAGEMLSRDSGKLSWLRAFLTIDAWRAAHAYPLRVVRTLLRQHAKVFDSGATVSGRLKRTISIVSKINRPRANETRLSTMQDIAGVRAILETVDQVKALTCQFRDEIGPKLHQNILKHNYIELPKADGYRSVHFVVKYQNRKFPHVPPRKVEVQLRTRLQHEWASAVETVDLFQRQDLKIGGGDTRWRRFFALVSGLFALEEGCPTVPDTPSHFDGLVNEIRPLWKELRVSEWLQHWADTVEHFTDVPDAAVYLVEVDVDKGTTNVQAWPTSAFDEAKQAYADAEKRNSGSNARNAVLVNADNIEEVKAAYPSYYGDTYSFLLSVRSALKAAEFDAKES